MASGYPASLDNFATTRADATPMAATHAADHNNLADAINKIEAELGIAPRGTFATVKARLDNIATVLTQLPAAIGGEGQILQVVGGVATWVTPTSGGGGGGGGGGTFGTLLPARISLAPAASGQTYYVDPSIGSDSNTITQAKSPSTPWASIQHALDTIPIPSVGSNTPVQLYLRGTDGTTTRGITITDDGPSSVTPAGYKQVSTTVSYQSTSSLVFPDDSPLTISNYPGERVLLGISFHLSKVKNVAFRASTVGGKRGIVIDGKFPVGITTLSGVKSIGSTNIELFGLEIRNWLWSGSSGGGIYVGAFGSPDNLSSTNIQIINCYVHHNGGSTSQGAHGIYWGGTSNGIAGAVNGAVYNNVVVYNLDDNISPHNASQGTIFSNNFVGGYGGSGSTGGSQTTPVTGGATFRTFTSGYEFFTLATDPSNKDNVIANSIIANNKIYGLNVFDSNTDPMGTNNVEQSNCYFGNGTAAKHQNATPDVTKFKFLSTLTNNDPLLAYWSDTVPPSSGSAFKPSSGSPCARAGDIRYTPAFDFDGNNRIYADIGPWAIS